MDIESELRLYNHVDFLGSKPVDRPQSTNVSTQNSSGPRRKQPYNAVNKRKKIADKTIKQTRKYSKKPIIPVESKRPQLDPFELMFFPPDYDPLPLHLEHRRPDKCKRKQSYLNEIKKIPNADLRKYRAKQDLRYLNGSADKQRMENIEDESKLFCVHHLTGKCKKTTCERVHQMREPRLFGVCKFFLSKSCAKGELCEFMHSEFPCRYYYLDLEHPKNSIDGECQFNHGGPLNNELNKYFKKHIEMWVKQITVAKPNEFNEKLDDFIDRFDLKQIKLEEEHNLGRKIQTIIIPKHSDKFTTWENCLDGNQLALLEKHEIDSIEKMNSASIDLLLECGLKMDQIYNITVNTCDRKRIPAQQTVESDDEILDFGNSAKIDSVSHLEKVSNETQQATIEKDSNENGNGIDEQSESDATESQSECDSVPDLYEDFEMSDDSDTDNLIINETENTSEKNLI